MISLEGRIARIEMVLSMIFKLLPDFIRKPLGKVVEIEVEGMEKDAQETMRLKRDTN